MDKVFGIPGAKIDRLFEKLEHEPGAPELIVTRHEQNAAFMAQAYARLTDKTGVVVATSGPGVGNLATGLMTAQAEGDAVLAIGGQVQRKDLQRQTHQSTPSVQLMAPITNYSAEVQDPANIEETLANAFAASQGAKHGAAFASNQGGGQTNQGRPVPGFTSRPAGIGPERSRSVARAVGTNGVAGRGNLPSGGGRDAGTGPDVLLWADWPVPQSSRGPAFAAKRFSRYDWLRRN